MDLMLTAAAAMLLIPVTILAAELLSSGLRAARPRPKAAQGNAVRSAIAVVIPAHNEALNIVQTLRSIKPQLGASDLMLVVADNCVDATAELAKTEGAQSIERHDLERRGKGYALDFAIRHLERQAPPAAVVIIDADCQVEPGAIDTLVATCLRTSRPTQATYLLHAPAGASFRTKIAEFACLVKNRLRPLGLHRLGLPCQLMGTGMAFPWVVIRQADLATGHIVEDVKLGVDLARAGTPPLFCPEALVTSTFPNSAEGIQNQRTRWEHGHLGIVLSEVPRLMLDAIVGRRLQLLALALDLSVPPLALLALQLTMVWVASLLLCFSLEFSLPLIISSAALFLLSACVLLVWRAHGRAILSLGNLAYALLYALWKVPMYIKFIVARQFEWVRSKRDDGSSDKV